MQRSLGCLWLLGQGVDGRQNRRAVCARHVAGDTNFLFRRHDGGGGAINRSRKVERNASVLDDGMLSRIVVFPGGVGCANERTDKPSPCYRGVAAKGTSNKKECEGRKCIYAIERGNRRTATLEYEEVNGRKKEEKERFRHTELERAVGRWL